MKKNIDDEWPDKVGINKLLVAAAKNGLTALLPPCPVDAKLIRKQGGKMTVGAVVKFVDDWVKSRSCVAELLRNSSALKRIVASRRAEFTAQLTRLAERRRRTPVTTSLSRAQTKPLGKVFFREIGTFWLNWDGLTFAVGTTSFVGLLLAEYSFQISTLIKSDWELTQDSFAGALGVCLGCTLAVVVGASWLRDLEDASESAHPSDKAVARNVFRLGRVGLVAMGLLFAGLSWDGAGLSALALLKSLVAFLSPPLLASVCLGLEGKVRAAFTSARAATAIENTATAELDCVEHELNCKLSVLEEIDATADSLAARVDAHIAAEAQPWIAALWADQERREQEDRAKDARRNLRLAELDLDEAQSTSEDDEDGDGGPSTDRRAA